MNMVSFSFYSDLTENEISELNKHGFVTVEKKGISGYEPIIEVIGQITITALSLLAGIAVAKIRKDEKVRLKYKKTEIEGISEEKLLEVIEKLKDEK